MEEREFKKITIINYICKLGLIIISFISIPITLEFLGDERYGLWQTILSMMTWLTIFNMGIPNSLRNKITENITKNNYSKIKKYISAAYLVLGFIAIIIFIIFINIQGRINLNSLFNTTVLNSELRLCIYITIIGGLINFVIELASAISLGIHKSTWVNISQLIANGISLISLILVNSIFKKSLVYMAIIYSTTNILINILLILALRKKSFNYTPGIIYIKKDYMKKVITMGKGFLLLQIVFMLVSTTDNLLITILIGPEQVTNYSIINKVFNIVITLFNILLIQVWSTTSAYYHSKQYDQIKKLLRNLLKLSIVIIVIIVIISISFDYISLLWLGEKLYINKILLLSTSIFAIVNIITAIFVNIQNGIGDVRTQTIGWIIGLILYIALAYIGCEMLGLGVIGISIAKTIAYICPLITVSTNILKLLNKKV